MGTILVLYAGAAYIIFLRGLFVRSPAGPVDVLSSEMGRDGNTVAGMASKSIGQSQALAMAARIAGCGIWTASGIVSPVIHIVGLAAVIPSTYMLVSFLWLEDAFQNAQIAMCLPLNFLPLLLCKGTPGLRAIAVIAFLGGCYQLASSQRDGRRSRMRI